MTVVLTYQGAATQRQEAEAKLRRALPGVVLTHKTRTTLEGDLAPEQAQKVADEGVWRVSRPVYAEIHPPSVNLSKLRRKLAGAK